MTNLEVYEKDPRTHALLNQGVAKVTSGRTAEEMKTLTYELTNFVCEGQYADGLERMLSTYLGYLDKTEQPGVWVSGFFGSGKSHLVKMLQHLWVDTEFADGAKARGLAKLPDKIKDLLKELTNAAKSQGGLHAAAGDLRSDARDSIRLGLLGIVFRSAGLPGDYNRACFVLWLREQGWEEGVRAFVKNAGGDFERELTNLYVSDHLAKAILSVNSDFAAKPADVKILLRSQFPPDTKDVPIETMIDRIKQALTKKGKFPLTLVVLDEVQQYIGDDVSRSKAVQDVKEQCCAGLGAKFLLVATGQNALTGTPLLQKLTGRFPVKVELQDTDVEQVTREVVLKKKPSAEPVLRKLLDAHIGEIERQLANTKIASTSKDRGLLVIDYPILPARRRFWERVLRAADATNTGAQLRNQLWVVYDAVKQTAALPLGHVVSGAHIYDSSIKSSALKSGTLLQEVAEKIARQKKESDGELRYQLCALIFLIGQLPNQGPLDAGVRADADTLADLLVTDLTASSADLRKRVAALLKELVAAGDVMKVETEYRMQTKEGADWNQAYQESKNRLLNDTAKLASERSQLLQTRCGDALKRFKLTQGASKEARKVELHFGDTAPAQDGGSIPVWVRDGWEVEEKAVLNDARVAGDGAAVIYGYIPKKQADELKQAIAGYYAAATTISAKGTPTTDEGAEAKRAMETLRDHHQRLRDSLVTEILNETTVYTAGGDQVAGTLLETKVKDAGDTCLARLYPLFDQADAPVADWEKVYTRAKNGAADALKAVGHDKAADAHPVTQAIANYVGSGKKGADVLKQFEAPKYGWPRDAINAGLTVLVQAGAVRAFSATKEPIGVGKLDQRTIATAEFRVENVKLTTTELILIRGLFQKLLSKVEPGQESVQAAEFLSRLNQLAQAAGGEAPLPKPPDTAHLTDLGNLVGNEQLKAIHERKDGLAREIAEWQKRKDLIGQRQPRWNQLTALMNFAGDLPTAAEVRPEVDAIQSNRTLLADPDPVPGLVEKLASALRATLNDAHVTCTKRHETGMAALEASPTWQQLQPDQKYKILSDHQIRVLPTIKVGTTEDILDTLRVTKLSEWHARRDAMPARFSQAEATAAKLLEPKAQEVTLASATIKTEKELKEWLADAEQRIRAKLKEGPVILG